MRAAAWLRPDITFFVATNDPIFALTLDDGPDPALTPDVLEVLRQHRARATFFLIGSRAQRHPDLVQRICDEGHEIGNHMWRDERAWRMSDEEFERSILMTRRTLDHVRPTRLLRPGSGFVSRRKIRLAEQHAYHCLLGSVYPFDAQVRHVRLISWLVRSLLQPGAIVILHEGTPSRQRVLPVLNDVLAEAQRRGLSAVTATELRGSPQSYT